MTIWPLNKFFGQTAQPVKSPPDGFELLERSQALLRFLKNEQDCHRVQLYLTDIEPREFCDRELMQELRIFMAIPGNRLDIYTHPDTPKRYNKLHSFLELVNESSKANLIPVSGDAIKHDFMLGSHGQTYIKTETGRGCYAKADAVMQVKLESWFESFQRKTIIAQDPVLGL